MYAIQLPVQAMVHSHLDHCRTLLAGLPAYTIKTLQDIPNSALIMWYIIITREQCVFEAKKVFAWRTFFVPPPISKASFSRF